MRRSPRSSVFLTILGYALVLLVSLSGVADEKAVNFQLIDSEGRAFELYRDGQRFDQLVLAAVELDAPNIDIGLTKHDNVIAIQCWPDEGRRGFAPKVAARNLPFPVLADPGGLVLNALGLSAGGNIVVDTEAWTIVARSDGPSPAPSKPEYSYSKDIVPILQKKCLPCHRPGGVAPMSFPSYRKVRGWSAMIREVLLTRRMPPWGADPAHGEFRNGVALTLDERRALLNWIDAGAPRGKGPDGLEEVEADRDPGKWALGDPDLVLELPEEQSLPAEGVFDYRYFDIPSGLTADRWARAMQVLPTNPRVAHHVIVMLRYPEERQHEQRNPESGLESYFAAYIPGQGPLMLPEDTGKLIPAGSTFRFQVHYNATGKEERDQSRMGIYFMDEAPARTMLTRAAADTSFRIPPGAVNSETVGYHRVPHDALLWDFWPHMHYRGRRMQFDAHYPDGTERTLLSVPAYDFDWQTLYRFKEAIPIPAGTIIVASGAFDNSPANPHNPDPEAAVYHGEQTYDEMFIGYMNYSIPSDAPESVLR